MGIESAGGAVSRRNIVASPNEDPAHVHFLDLESHDVSIMHTQPEPFFTNAYRLAGLQPRVPATYRIAY